MNPNSKLAAMCLSGLFVLAGCDKVDPNIDEQHNQSDSLLSSREIELPEILSRMPPGVYEVGVSTVNGSSVCKVSIISAFDAPNSVILAQCRAATQDAKGLVKKVPMPEALSKMPLGVYQVEITSSDGLETCNVSLIRTARGLFEQNKEVVIGDCVI